MYLMRDSFVHLYADVSFLSQLPFIICFLEAGVRVIEKKRGPLPKDMSGDNFRTLLNRDGCVLIVYKSQSKLPSTVCLKCIKDVSQENSQLFPQLGKVLLNTSLA